MHLWYFASWTFWHSHIKCYCFCRWPQFWATYAHSTFTQHVSHASNYPFSNRPHKKEMQLILPSWSAKTSSIWPTIWSTVWPKNHSSAVIIMTGHTLDGWGVRVWVPVGKEFSLLYPYRLWSPPNILYSVYWQIFLQEKSNRGMKLTTHLQLLLKSRKSASPYPLPIHFHSIVLS
jgi:hypothetical protein